MTKTMKMKMTTKMTTTPRTMISALGDAPFVKVLVGSEIYVTTARALDGLMSPTTMSLRMKLLAFGSLYLLVVAPIVATSVLLEPTVSLARTLEWSTISTKSTLPIPKTPHPSGPLLMVAAPTVAILDVLATFAAPAQMGPTMSRKKGKMSITLIQTILSQRY
jgi:hypothetical protein